MKKQLFLFVLILLSMVANATVKIKHNGVYYNLIEYNKEKFAEVTSMSSGKYTGSVVIPSTVTFYNVTYNVTSIGNGAFGGCSGLTSITIPNSVTSIGNEAFGGCSGLTSITIPNSVTSIGEWAFRDCTGLTSITIPNSVTRIESNAFIHCSGLTSITIPNSVTSIGNEAFSFCSGLTSITIGNSVTSIGNYAFRNCSGLTSVTIPNSVTSIGFEAFYGTPWYHDQLDGLVYAGKVAYKYKGVMPENTSIVLEDGTLGISGGAFYNCRGLTSITIPNSVKSIGLDAFWGCSGLTSITIPNSVESIGNEAFWCCSGLTSITIPNSVTSIGEWAFYGCKGLTSITIGNSVTSIGNYAFVRCSGLTDFYCYAEKVPSAGSDVFGDAPVNTATLHVPAASIDAYKAADPWKAFGTIVALTPEETGVKPITATENPSDRKFMENGRLIIQKNGQRYNVAGQMVNDLSVDSGLRP